MESMKVDARASLAELRAKFDELRAAQVALEARCTALESLVGGRNKSAATKRNMTDADALAVLTGEWKGLNHKDAAAASGLTYAQVYSCRCEFTFKHVHKDLRRAKWVNPWAKP